MIKKLFDALTVPEKGKISDKTMTFNIVACVAGMLLCVLSLTAATWAWFGDSITSPVNQVQTGEYKVQIKITDSATGNEVLPDSKGVYSLESNGVYDVKLEADGTVSTGYFALSFASAPEKKFYTPQMFTEHSGKSPTSISFRLVCTEAEKLTVGAWWGTYSVPDADRDIQNGESYTFDAVAGALNPNNDNLTT